MCAHDDFLADAFIDERSCCRVDLLEKLVVHAGVIALKAAWIVTRIPTMSAGLQTELTNLDAALRALVCTYRGSAAPVNPAKYPDIRYIRHEKDGFVGEA